MSDFITGWQCIGCGRLEAPQPCIGICQDRKVELVNAQDYRSVLAQLAEMRAQRDAFAARLRWLASIKPAPGTHERALEVFQLEAQQALRASHTTGESPG